MNFISANRPLIICTRLSFDPTTMIQHVPNKVEQRVLTPKTLKKEKIEKC